METDNDSLNVESVMFLFNFHISYTGIYSDNKNMEWF